MSAREWQCRCGDLFTGSNPPWWMRTDYGLCPKCRELPEFKAMADDFAREAVDADWQAARERPRERLPERRPRAMSPRQEPRPTPPPPTEPPPEHRIVAVSDPAEGWPPFVPLATASPVPPMSPDMVPTSLRGWAWDAAERKVVAPEMIVVAALTSASALVGRRVGVSPRALDDWTEIPNQYGMIVGASGSGKSPAEREGLRFYREIAKEARAAHTGEGPAPPYIVSDATAEIIAIRMKEITDGRALLVMRPEMTGLFATFRRSGREGDRNILLEGHDGHTWHRDDRITRDAVAVRMCLAFFGTVQPGVLQPLIAGAQRNGIEADGLLQRFSLAVFPEPPPQYRTIDRPPNLAERNRAERAFRRLARLDADAVGARPPEGGSVPSLRFRPDAQEEFTAWHDALATRVLQNPDGRSPAFLSHLNKYRGFVATLALLLHLLDLEAYPSKGIDRLALGRALAMADYLEQHALKIYGEGGHGVPPGVAALAEMIKAGEIRDGAQLRDVYRKGRVGLTNKHEALAAARDLERRGWLRLEPSERRSVTIRLRPDHTSIASPNASATGIDGVGRQRGPK